VTGQGRGNLRGLVRLRGLRERDSRIGLSTALSEERDAAARVSELERQLGGLPTPASSDVATFQALQHRVELLGGALVDARAGREAARQLTLVARNRWVEDRSRLAAVESLVARRTAAVREERRRRDNRELDEIAGELWRRQQHDRSETESQEAS
jgi:flagellar FliJ protein